MREIELPITQTFSITVDTHNFDWSKAVDMGNGQFGIPLENIVDEEKSAITETARLNGGKILYATTSIEQQMESLLLMYFMGPFEGHREKRAMFEKEILQSSALSYNAKKNLITKIVQNHELMPGKKKNRLQGYLKKIMEWRNAFAHGKVQHDNISGCFIRYYSGEPKNLQLTDEYWDEVESSFKECSDLLKQALGKIEDINA